MTDKNAAEPQPHAPLAGRRLFMGFTIGYWMLNIIEMFERLAYYSIRSVVAIYIMQADETHGLHFTAAQKGTIYSLVVHLPVAAAHLHRGLRGPLRLQEDPGLLHHPQRDRLPDDGHPHQLRGLLAGSHRAGHRHGLLQAQPSRGSLAHNVTRRTPPWGGGSSTGSSTSALHRPVARQNWHALRSGLAGPVLHRRRYHESELPDALHLQGFYESGADKTEGPWKVFKRTLRNLGDARLITWLLIMSCFWLMMYSLWDLQPNFLTDWNDSWDVA